MKDFVSTWLTELLERRADKSWSPVLYAAPDTAAYLGEIAGLTVQPSEMPAGVLVVFGEGVDEDGIPYRQRMARYDGIAAPGAGDGEE